MCVCVCVCLSIHLFSVSKTGGGLFSCQVQFYNGGQLEGVREKCDPRTLEVRTPE